ncbi:Retinol dehydrogenase 14 [Linderina pennispora]|nr:Retinol dehydrogenase 14 [Linderina pennispora]
MDSRLMLLLGAAAQGFIEYMYGAISKVDVSGPSYISRIDRILMDYRNAHMEDTAGEKNVAIVTGANSGVGFVTASALIRAGYQTVLACRNPELAQEALDHLRRQTGLNNCEVMRLDLASLVSVNEFVEQFKAKYKSLDILVNNAGVMACPYAQTKDDIEMQFGTNHIGHFSLTVQLLDCLKAAEHGARVVNVSSMMCIITAGIDYGAIGDRTRYSPAGNYTISKLANIMFSTALARRLGGTKVTVNSLHPGTVATNLGRHMTSSAVIGAIARLFAVDVHEGAFTSIYLALSPEVDGVSGKFFMRGEEASSHPNALDKMEQEKLWEYSEKLIAEKLVIH